MDFIPPWRRRWYGLLFTCRYGCCSRWIKIVHYLSPLPVIIGILIPFSFATLIADSYPASAFHHGGGVGMGYSLHAGMVVVADGSERADRRLGRVLTTDPG
jgi:hypothetical protein